MLRAGIEPTIPVSEGSKTVRALDRAAIRTGYYLTMLFLNP